MVCRVSDLIRWRSRGRVGVVFQSGRRARVPQRMEDLEAADKALRAAEHKMQALHNLTWRAGAGAAVWARAA